MSRHYNINLVKYFLAYSTDDIANLFGVNTSTVRRWISLEGLKPIDSNQPFLFYGQTLKDFLGKLNTKQKQKVDIDQMFCMKCRVPRKPYKRHVFMRSQADKVMKLVGVCPICKTTMNIARSLDSYSELSKLLIFRPLEELELFNCKTPCVNKQIFDQANNKESADGQLQLFGESL